MTYSRVCDVGDVESLEQALNGEQLSGDDCGDVDADNSCRSDDAGALKDETAAAAGPYREE